SGSAATPDWGCRTRRTARCSTPTTGRAPPSGRSRSATGSRSPPCRCSSPTTSSPTTASTWRPSWCPRCGTPRARPTPSAPASSAGSCPRPPPPSCGRCSPRWSSAAPARRRPSRATTPPARPAPPASRSRGAATGTRRAATTTSRPSPGSCPPRTPSCRSSWSSTSRPRRPPTRRRWRHPPSPRSAGPPPAPCRWRRPAPRSTRRSPSPPATAACGARPPPRPRPPRRPRRHRPRRPRPRRRRRRRPPPAPGRPAPPRPGRSEVRFRELAASVEGVPTRTAGAPDDPELTALEHDTRTVRPGALFCCVRGSRVDGHDLAADALAAGAVALLVDHELPLPVPQLVVEDVRAALGPVAATFWGHPSRDLTVVGVTGTAGKTTLTHLVAAVLTAAGRPCGVLGTLSGARTTPEAPELQARLAEHRRRGDAAVAMEVSSHGLELHRVDATSFAVAVFTNLSQDHLDFHGTMEAYFRAKARLFTP